MNLAGLNPFDEVKYIKVFGAPNSATVYLEALLAKNLKVELADYFTLGWKHRLAPGQDEITEEVQERLLLMSIVKNPYSWLLSMHRRPYKQSMMSQLHFSDFIRFPYGDYRNAIVMWNLKVASYLKLGDYTPNFHLVKYEELLAAPQKEMEAFSDKFKVAKTISWFSDIDKYVNDKHEQTAHTFHKRYYLEKKWLHDLHEDDLYFINQHLDKRLMEQLGYEVVKV